MLLLRTNVRPTASFSPGSKWCVLLSSRLNQSFCGCSNSFSSRGLAAFARPFLSPPQTLAQKIVTAPIRQPILVQVRQKFDFSKKPMSPVQQRNKSFAFRFKRLFFPSPMKTSAERSKTTMIYMLGLAILTCGASYAAVPLYRIFCQASGYGGTTQAVGHDSDKVETLQPNKERRITVRFNADTAATMQWNFRPQQNSVTLYPGETALAFYTAKNPTDKPIDGISTYNVIPFEAGQYFNKIQCFCFEEQRLNPNEEVDMPVFFYIDPEFVDDPYLEKVDEIHLSYTFFESKPGLQLPVYH